MQVNLRLSSQSDSGPSSGAPSGTCTPSAADQVAKTSKRRLPESPALSRYNYSRQQRLEENLKLHEELCDVCLDMMARYTNTPCSALHSWSPTTSKLLASGRSCSWLVGHVVVTVTTSQPAGYEAPCLSRNSVASSANSGSKPTAAMDERENSLCGTSSAEAILTQVPLGLDSGMMEESSALPLYASVRGMEEWQEEAGRALPSGWAAVMIRRPCSNTAWLMRLQNKPSIVASAVPSNMVRVTPVLRQLYAEGEVGDAEIETVLTVESSLISSHHASRSSSSSAVPIIDVGSKQSSLSEGTVTSPPTHSDLDTPGQSPRTSLLDNEKTPVKTENMFFSMGSGTTQSLGDEWKSSNKVHIKRLRSHDHSESETMDDALPVAVITPLSSSVTVTGNAADPRLPSARSSVSSTGSGGGGSKVLAMDELLSTDILTVSDVAHSTPRLATKVVHHAVSIPQKEESARYHADLSVAVSQATSSTAIASSVSPSLMSASALSPPFSGSDAWHRSPSFSKCRLDSTSSAGGQRSTSPRRCTVASMTSSSLESPVVSSGPGLDASGQLRHGKITAGRLSRPSTFGSVDSTSDVSTMSMSLPYPSSHSSVQYTADHSAESVGPSFIFLQLFYSGMLATQDAAAKSGERPIQLRNNESVERSLRVLDRTAPYETHRIGVLYVDKGQSSYSAVLANTHGSQRYEHFLNGLGDWITLVDCTPTDVFLGGLSRQGNDGDWAISWQDDISQVIYHVATLMPTDPTDPSCTAKLAHIGNDYVKIIYNGSGADVHSLAKEGQYSFASIVISPLPLAINELSIVYRDGVESLMVCSDCLVVSDMWLPTLVRQLAVHANLASQIHHSRNKDSSEIFCSNWVERLRAIGRIRRKAINYGDSAHGDFTDYS